MVGKRKKAKMALAALQPVNIARQKKKTALRAEQLNATKESRRVKKLEKRRHDKQAITAQMWAAPVPSHLVARLDVPKITTKHKTYFEIADNHEKKKKLEFTVTNDRNPPPGFTFVAVGDPDLTKECKELSRERDAMILIVSDSREEHSKIAEHVHRAGYHFRESIVEDARAKLGNKVISRAPTAPGFYEPIPATQEEMSKQAEGALLDLFPRIPNTDREMIIRHAFKKGGTFQGEPTVGNQAEIPLSRRVQLAALAHIRHVHTRYDKLLRETTWMNARKAVEPVCLDILLKWRGDEETGRDQMDEILREVVVITDSEGEEESSDEDEDESSDEDSEVTSSSSVEGSVEIISRNAPRTRQPTRQATHEPGQRIALAADPRPLPIQPNGRDRGARDRNQQKGFKRYQAAFDDAKNRLKNPAANSHHQSRVPSSDIISGRPVLGAAYPIHNTVPQMNSARLRRLDEYNGHDAPESRAQPGPNYSQSRPTSINMARRDEVTMRPLPEFPAYSHAPLPHLHTSYSKPPQVVRGSPTKNVLQDLLVPSIETGSNNFSSPSNAVGHSGFRAERQVDSYPHGPGERKGISPTGRRVIVIDDDSPQPKRRRVIDLDPSHLRTDSSLNRPYMQPGRFESPRLRNSVQPREFDVSHSRGTPQPVQGLSQNLSGGNPLPVYDAPQNGFFAAHPRQLGMQEVEYRAPSRYGNGYDREVAQYGRERDRSLPRDKQFTNPNQPRMMAAEPYYGVARAPEYRINGPPTQPQHRSSAVDQDFVPSFSQSHLGANQPMFSNHAPPQQRYEPPYQSYSAPAPIQQRPPVQYMERPMQYTNSTQHEQRYDGHNYGRPAMVPEQPRQPYNGEVPSYVRTVDPRGRNVIILD